MTNSDRLSFFESDDHFRWELLKEAVDKFSEYFASKFPKLKVEESSDVLNWEDQIGVYLIFDCNSSLFYVGEATVNFGSRISDHKNTFECSTVDLIVFPTNIRCFIPALERFLIKELQPLGNTLHKN